MPGITSIQYYNDQSDRIYKIGHWEDKLQSSAVPLFIVSDPGEQVFFAQVGAESIPVTAEDAELFIKTVSDTRPRYPLILTLKQGDEDTGERLKKALRQSAVNMDLFDGEESAEAASEKNQDAFRSAVNAAIESVKAVKELEAERSGNDYLKKWGALDTSDPPDPAMFHHIKDGIFKGVYDARIYEYIKARFPMFFIGSTPYIYQAGVYIPDNSGNRLKSMIRELILPQFLKADVLTRIYKLFSSDSELEKSIEEVNTYPGTWVNFKNGFFDIWTWEMIPHDPKYLSINQIPHEFDLEAEPSGDQMEEWLRFIVPEEGDREMLLEYIGYAMTKDTSMQTMLLAVGTAGAGKSTLLSLIGHVVGEVNSSNVSLQALSDKFSPSTLVGKLVNICADLDIDILKDLGMFKRLTGEDRISVQFKYKDEFQIRNYAKLIFSTNQTPEIAAERTDAFYRRARILKFDRAPVKHDPGLLDKLLSEIDYLILISLKAARRMYHNGFHKDSDRSKAAKEEMKIMSDNVEAWIAERVTIDSGGKADRTNCYKNYVDFCYVNGTCPLKAQKFYLALKDKGFGIRKSNNWFISGLRLGKDLGRSGKDLGK